MTPSDPPSSDPTPVVPLGSPPPPPEWLGPGTLVPLLVLMIAVGFFLFGHGYATRAGNELSRPQSALAAVNAATLTGFQQARNPNDYTPFGRRLTLTLMVGGTLFSLVGGGLAVTRLARLPYRDAAVAGAAVAAVGVVAIVGVVTMQGPGRTWFDGMYQAVSAFGNGGLYTGRLPSAAAPRSLFVLLPLAFLGSLGVPVLLDLGRGRPSAHTVRVLSASAAVYLLAVVVLVPVLAWRDHVGETLSAVPPETVRASWVVANARSAGFPFQFVTYLPPAAAVVLLLVMSIGGAPGGTAGGLKVTTLPTLAGGVADAVRGRPVPRAFGMAVGWVAAYAATVAVTWFALVLAEPDKRPDRLLFLSASAVGNVGLSHDPLSPSTAGYWILSIAMLAGRVMPVVGLWTAAGMTNEGGMTNDEIRMTNQ